MPQFRCYHFFLLLFFLIDYTIYMVNTDDLFGIVSISITLVLFLSLCFCSSCSRCNYRENVEDSLENDETDPIIHNIPPSLESNINDTVKRSIEHSHIIDFREIEKSLEDEIKDVFHFSKCLILF